MKRIFLILLFIPVLSFGQFSKKELSNVVLTSSLSFASGLCDGAAEYLKFHCTSNSTFWNPNLSWTNKWKNGDPAQGEKFWQSSRALVWTTDGYHMMRMGRNVFAMSAIVVHFGKPEKWYVYVVEFVVNYFAYTLGFTVTYELLK